MGATFSGTSELYGQSCVDLSSNSMQADNTKGVGIVSRERQLFEIRQPCLTTCTTKCTSRRDSHEATTPRHSCCVSNLHNEPNLISKTLFNTEGMYPSLPFLSPLRESVYQTYTSLGGINKASSTRPTFNNGTPSNIGQQYFQTSSVLPTTSF